jgi:hypothetical protein
MNFPDAVSSHDALIHRDFAANTTLHLQFSFRRAANLSVVCFSAKKLTGRSVMSP